MPEMTPEQNERWRAAINQLDYLDFHACEHEGIWESRARLERLGVPGWAWEMRAHLITLGWEPPEVWVPNFALRSDVALTGLQFIYPNHNDRVTAYQRVMLGFIRETLRPFVEFAAGLDDDVRRNYYHHLTHVFEMAGRLENPTNEDYDSWEMAQIQASGYDRQFVHEARAAMSLACNMLTEWQDVVFFENKELWQWEKPERESVQETVRLLNSLHLVRVGGAPNPETGLDWYLNLIADAYLAALEAECPAPEWLPREGVSL